MIEISARSLDQFSTGVFNCVSLNEMIQLACMDTTLLTNRIEGLKQKMRKLVSATKSYGSEYARDQQKGAA